MQVGLILAIKTLADRFQPLAEVYRDFTDEAVLAEQLGFDFVSTSEHHFADDAWSPSQLPILANLAGRTSRLRLQTNIFLLPLHHPLRVSEDAATVDILSNGRLDLICGSGSVREEFVALGADDRSRWGLLFEGLEIIRRSFDEDSFSFTGRHYSIPDVIRQTTKPVQHPFPLWVGGFGPKLHYRAGRSGYHSQGPADFHPEYLRGLAEAGIDPSTRNLACFVSGHLAADRATAWDEAREGWWNWQNEYQKRDWMSANTPPLPSYDKLGEPPEFGQPMAPALGNPDDILDQLRPMLEKAQTTHFGFAFRSSGGGMPTERVRETMELFAKEVLPVLKTWGREPLTSKAVG